MGIAIRKSGIVFQCDHPNCTSKTNRPIARHARNPFRYWLVVLKNPRRWSVKKFFLSGDASDWPDGISVFCEDHREKPVPEKITQDQQDSVQSYMDARRDIFD